MKTLGTIMAIGALFTLGMVSPGHAAPGPGGCDERFQSGDPLLKFCQGLNAGIGEAEIHIKSLAMMVQAEVDKCEVFRFTRKGEVGGQFVFSTSSNDEKCRTAFAKFNNVQAPEPLYLKGDRYKGFFSEMAAAIEKVRNPNGNSIPSTAVLVVVADYKEKISGEHDRRIVFVTSYKTNGPEPTFKNLRSGYLCPALFAPKAAKGCDLSSDPASTLKPMHADPNGWESYKILGGYGQDRLVEVTYKLDPGGGTPIEYPIPEYCRPDSYYVQAARAHFNFVKHPHPPHGKSVTVDFCACSHYDSDGLCLVN